EVSGRVVATRLAFLYGDELYLYFSGYEPDYGKYSVMTTLVAEVLRWCFEQRIRLVNLSPGADVSKTRWSPDELKFASGIVRSRSVRGQLAESAYSSVVECASEVALLGRVASYVKRAR